MDFLLLLALACVEGGDMLRLLRMGLIVEGEKMECVEKLKRDWS